MDSSRLMSSGLLRPQSSKTYTSLLQNPPKSNSKVKMPFKQSTIKPQHTTIVMSPGREMLERTVLATSVINKVLREHVPPKVQHVHGRLLKARLKPLEPVHLTSPTIQQCRGIVAETRAYTASNSRTFQRWKAIMSSAQHFRPLITDLKDNMSIGESLHRTSEATSPVPSLDPSSELDFDLDDTNLAVCTSKDNVSFLINSNSELTAQGTSESATLENNGEQNSNRGNSIRTELVTEYNIENVITQANDSEVAVTLNNAQNRRPQSAFYPQDSETGFSSRPKTAGESIRPKSVRFADENKRLCSDSVKISSKDKNIEEKNKMNKTKVSCRPDSGDQVLPDDQDDQGNSGQDGGCKSGHSTVTSTENVSNHKCTEVNNLSSENKSKSSSNTNFELTDEDMVQLKQKSCDKEPSLPRPKSASVFYETRAHKSDHPQQLDRVTLDIKSHTDERFANHKKKKYANDKNKIKEMKIHKCDTFKDKRDGSIEKNEDVDCLKTSSHVAHLPPTGLNQQLNIRPKKKTTDVKNRPISASACINKDILQRKYRPYSANKITKVPDNFIFTERNNILSRHGLLGKKRPSSVPSNMGGHAVHGNQQHAASRFRSKSPAKSKGHKRLIKCKPHKSSRKDEALNHDNMTDAEKMWKELPDDDDLLDDPIMCKFDELENEFLLNKEELQSGILKYAVKEVTEDVKSWDDEHKTEEDKVEQFKTNLVKIPLVDLTVDDDVEEILCIGDGETPDLAQTQVHESKAVTFISSLLYKKTNLFVPVSRRRCVQHHHAHATRNAKGKSDTKVAAGVDEANSVGNDQSKLRNINGGENSVLDEEVINDLCETAANILGGQTTEIEGGETYKMAMNEQLSKTRWQLEQDYPCLTRLFQDKTSDQMCTSVADKDLTGRQSPTSDADSTCHGGLYTELLHAYRRHFEESSDEDSDEGGHEDYDEGIMTKSKKMQLHQKSAKFSSSHQLSLRRGSHDKHPDSVKLNKTIGDVNVLDTLAVSKTRPWSGTTIDSGLESDTPSNEGGDEREAAIVEKEYKNLNKNHLTSFTNNGTKSDDPIQKATLKSMQPDTKVISALEIVAQAKKLSKSRKKQPSKEDMSTLCHVPPLCFRLNARPPSGHLFYFAYVQNMSLDRILAYLAVMDKPLVRYWALLFGFELVFNKKADLNSDKEVGGFPNLSYNASSSVEGCLYQLTPDHLECLDKFMGYPQLCEHIVIPVWMSNCSNPDDLGVAQFCVPACTFIARDEFIWTEPIHPNEFAISQCVKAADLLTPAYKDHLLTFVQPSVNTSPSVLAT